MRKLECVEKFQQESRKSDFILTLSAVLEVLHEFEQTNASDASKTITNDSTESTTTHSVQKTVSVCGTQGLCQSYAQLS
jgi:hypothetical protein